MSAAQTEYITKDSGAREQFASGMVRDTEAGKPLWHLIFSGPMLVRWVGLMTRGALKYAEDNWMLAEGEAELKRFRKSAFRHFCQWYRGDTDEDHAAAVFFNINGAEYVKGKHEHQAGNELLPQHPQEAAVGLTQRENEQPLQPRDSGLLVLGAQAGPVGGVQVARPHPGEGFYSHQ